MSADVLLVWGISCITLMHGVEFSCVPHTQHKVQELTRNWHCSCSCSSSMYRFLLRWWHEWCPQNQIYQYFTET